MSWAKFIQRAKEFFKEPEEIVVGVVFMLCWAFFLGFWVIPAAALNGFLWKMGGWEHGNRYWRRIGVPLNTMLFLFISLGDPVWSCALLFAALSLGYGIPDPRTGDKGSAIGRFWYKACDKNEQAASFATRMTIGYLCSLSMAALVFYSATGWFIGAFLFPVLFASIERLVE